MLRAVSHLPANHGQGKPVDSITLAHDERRLRRKLLRATAGTEVMVDFPQTITLDHHGALLLDDGRLVEILAASEDLFEIRAKNPAHLVRLAWHIGNRHTSAQLEDKRILIKRDHVLKTMLEGLDARVTNVTEPFFAEHGAYHSHAEPGHALLAPMSASSDLQKLLTWLSPAFPVGAFAWSAGLEAAIVARTVHDRATTQQWIEANLTHGSMRTDAILLAHAHRAAVDAGQLQELSDLCLALTPARERHDETTITGAAFAIAAKAWPNAVLANLPQPCPYPIAVGAIASGHGIDLTATLLGYLTATVHSQVSVAVRLVPIGQSDGLATMAALEPAIASMAALCQHAALDDIGAVAYAADIAQMTHETLTTRIFRS